MAAANPQSPESHNVRWLAPETFHYLTESKLPQSVLERIRDGFRVALWTPNATGGPRAWLTATIQKGGVGFFDPPGAFGLISTDAAAALLTFAAGEFAPQCGIIQLMLPRGEGVLETAALESGFQFGADLLLLGRELRVEEVGPRREEFVFSPCGEELPELLNKTYEGTLDCPLLTGKRPIGDVIEGYAATGEGGRGSWRTLYVEGRPVGCVLVAGHPNLEIAELVYMGLAPLARGQGLGFSLLEEAERLAMERGFRRMVIGVDAANAPAMRVYEESGYVRWEEKRVFLWLKQKD